MSEIGHAVELTGDEESRLAILNSQGDEDAREKLIKAHLHTVVTLAYGFRGLGVSFEDLVSEGNIGLIRAVALFDATKGARLGTYANLWIRRSMQRAIAKQGKTIRLPVDILQEIGRMRRCASEMTEALGREPTPEELAERLGVERSRVANLQEVSGQSSLDVEDDDGNSSFLDSLSDPNAVTPLASIINVEGYNLMRSAIYDGCVLTERESVLIRKRFGWDGEEPCTIDEVGQILGVSRPTVRQIQAEALRKLRKVIESM